MRLAAPTEIKEIAWEGSLEPPETAKAPGDTPRPVVTIGKPEIWDTADALKNEVNQVWTPPLTAANFWLVRLACTLREPPGLRGIAVVHPVESPQCRDGPDGKRRRHREGHPVDACGAHEVAPRIVALHGDVDERRGAGRLEDGAEQEGLPRHFPPGALRQR